MSQLKKYNAVVFGISADSVALHKQFHDEEHLNFDLLADPEKRTLSAYGVLNAAGGINRYTVVVGPDGRVRGIDRTVNSQFSRDGGQFVSRHGIELALMLSPWRAAVGRSVPPMTLTDANGNLLDLVPPGKKAAVLVFWSTTCPVCKAYLERMNALASASAYNSVSFVGVYSNVNESAAAIKRYASAQHVAFASVRDQRSSLANHFHASHTPEAWVINASGLAVYHGGIDDSQAPAGVHHSYLHSALDAVLAGKTPSPAETRSFGCAIRRH